VVLGLGLSSLDAVLRRGREKYSEISKQKYGSKVSRDLADCLK
jgi:hypothetical protein